jgi:TIR domain
MSAVRREPTRVSTQVFISYRRADSARLAGLLRDRLVASFADARVFMDVHSIFPGDDFPERIVEALEDTDVFLALIGSEWLGTDATGHHRRIDDERDFVRIEVATALEVNVHVLPVLLESANMPSPQELPLDVGMIGRLNARRLRKATFDADYDLILGAVRKLVEAGRRLPEKVPKELVGLWVSTGMGDAVQQYDFYSNGTYQHVGITRQQLPNGMFEFEVFHEGAVTVTGGLITFEAFRATASRSHPDHPAEDYANQSRRAETATLTWRLQPRGAQKFLVLGDGSAPAVVYRYFERPRSSTRARQTPAAPPAPVGTGDTASGAMVDWFPLFGEERGARFNRLTGWKLMSTPGDTVVNLFDPQGAVYDIDISSIPRDGKFKPFNADGRLLPIEIGWYGGGAHQGTRQDGTYGKYDVAPGYIARWVNTP